MYFNFTKIKNNLKSEFKKRSLSLQELNIILCESLKIDMKSLILKDKINLLDYLKIKVNVLSRFNGKPTNKIFKKTEFYGLRFLVDRNVLAPRQETEILVTETIKLLNKNDTVLDLCTGSGCIAISLKKNADCFVTASDISKHAIFVAKKNAKINNVKIHFVISNLFDKINERFNVVVCNPPYIKTKDIKTLKKDVKKYDPHLALDGGTDGLQFYTDIVKELKNKLYGNGKVLFEIGKGQCLSVKKILKQHGFKTTTIKDLNSVNRVIIGEMKWLKN